jgi:hypothetical protein
VAKVAWLTAIAAIIAMVIVGSLLLGPWLTVPSFSCTSGNVIECAIRGFEGIRSLFSGYFPNTIASLAELLVIALAIAFIAVLFYMLKKSRENST